MEDEVTYLCGELGREGCDNVVEFGLLLRNPPGSELCLHLGEPHVGVGGPKGRELTAATLTGAVAAAVSLSPSTDMAFVERDDRACRFAVVRSWSPMWEIYFHIPHMFWKLHVLYTC